MIRYEAKVIKLDDARALVHFKGWGKSADEWLSTDDGDRLRPHRLHTCGVDFKEALFNLKHGDRHGEGGGDGGDKGKRDRASSSSASSSSSSAAVAAAAASGGGGSTKKRPRSTSAANASSSSSRKGAAATTTTTTTTGRSVGGGGGGSSGGGGASSPSARSSPSSSTTQGTKRAGPGGQPCECCGEGHDGAYGSGRFCSQSCRSRFNGRKGRPAPSSPLK